MNFRVMFRDLTLNVTLQREIAHLFNLPQQAVLHISNRYFPGTIGCQITTESFLLKLAPFKPILSQGGAYKDDSQTWVTLCLKPFSGSQSPQRKPRHPFSLILTLPFLPHFIMQTSWMLSQLREPHWWPGFTRDWS